MRCENHFILKYGIIKKTLKIIFIVLICKLLFLFNRNRNRTKAAAEQLALLLNVYNRIDYNLWDALQTGGL